MLLWVTSFADSNPTSLGHLETEDDAKRVYQNLLVTSVALTTVLIPGMIYGIDRWHLGYMISLIFFARSIILVFGFPFVKLPNGWGAYICSTIMISCSGLANVACETYFMKMIPSDISGSMRGVFNMFG
jgi:hypothetical protein